MHCTPGCITLVLLPAWLWQRKGSCQVCSVTLIASLSKINVARKFTQHAPQEEHFSSCSRPAGSGFPTLPSGPGHRSVPRDAPAGCCRVQPLLQGPIQSFARENMTLPPGTGPAHPAPRRVHKMGETSIACSRAWRAPGRGAFHSPAAPVRALRHRSCLRMLQAA